MAIYSLHAQVISRGYSESAVAAIAYRRGIALTDERTGIKHDYSSKHGPIYNEMTIPENSPEWVKDLQKLNESNPVEAASKLWNMVEKKEPQWNSELSREYRIALPIELTAAQNIALTRAFIESTFASRGIISDWCIHFDVGNPHVHIMNTTRFLTNEGFGNKDRDLGKLKFLYDVRQEWEVFANSHLLHHGINACIDRRSLKEQGFKLKATKHLGKSVIDQERRGIKTERMKAHRDIQEENLNTILENPQELLNMISSESTHFTEEKAVQTLARYINPHDEQFSVFTENYLQTREVEQENHFNPHVPFDKIIEAEALEKMQQEDSVYQNNTSTEESKKSPSSLDEILEKTVYHESVFSEKDLALTLNKITDNAEGFTQAYIKVKAELASQENVIKLGIGDDGREQFTTRHLFDMENNIQTTVDNLRQTTHSLIEKKTRKAGIRARERETGNAFTKEQIDAITHMTSSSQISCLVGRAGTGKSFTVGAVREIYESQGFKVQGIALSAVAANGLRKDAGIKASTIEALKMAIEKGGKKLSKNDVIIMDEAGMTDVYSMDFVLKEVAKSGAKLILMGDPDQLQPVGPSAIFRAILERVGHRHYAEIIEIFRQKEQWQKEATVAFARGDTATALKAYEDHACIHLEKTKVDAINQLVSDWKTCFLTNHDLTEQIVISHENRDVSDLNQALRQVLIDEGVLQKEGYTLEIDKQKSLTIVKGDRLVFLKNDGRFGVSNGSFGTVTSVHAFESGKVKSLCVRLDGDDKDTRIDANQYKTIDYGYASTVHKSQGATKNHAFILASGNLWDRAMTYVAMTRHRYTAKLYASRDNFPTLSDLKKSLGKMIQKDSVLNYPLAFARRRGIEPNSKGLGQHLAQKIRQTKDKLIETYQHFIDPVALKEKKVREKSVETRDAVRKDSVIVAHYKDISTEISELWSNMVAELQSKGITKQSPRFFERLKTLPEYDKRSMLIEKRDALAFSILPKKEKFDVAIELNRIDVNTLEKHATTHVIRERIKAYQTALTQKNTFLSQRIAYTIFLDIKAHYPLLKNLEVDTKALSQAAKVYHQRLTHAHLTKDEKIAFDRVKRFSALVPQIGAKFGQLNQKPNLPEQEVKWQTQLNALSKEKELLAAQIFNAPDVHDKGLDYFSIGKATAHFGQAISSDEHAKASKRWYQLEQSAFRANARMLIEKYQQMDFDKKHVLRDQLAHKIHSNMTLYYPYIKNANLSINILNTQDMAHKKRLYFASLTPAERQTLRSSFETVETYLNHTGVLSDDFKAHGLDGKRIYQGAKAPEHEARVEDKEHEPKSIDSSTKRHVIKMVELAQQSQKLAHTIMEDVEAYQTALNFFGIHLKPEGEYQLSLSYMNDVTSEQLRNDAPSQKYAFAKGDTLKSAATRYALTQKIRDYQKAVEACHHDTAKTIAIDIMADSKAYASSIRSVTGNLSERKALWQSIKENAHQHWSEKEAAFVATLNSEERKAHAEINAYLAAKKAHNKAWHEMIEAKGYVVRLKTENHEKLKSGQVLLSEKDGQLVYSVKTPSQETIIDALLNALNLSDEFKATIISAFEAKKSRLPSILEAELLEKTAALKQTRGSYGKSAVFASVGWTLSAVTPTASFGDISGYVLVIPINPEKPKTLYYVDKNQQRVTAIPLSVKKMNALIGKVFYKKPIRYTLLIQEPPKDHLKEGVLYLHKNETAEWCYSIKTPFAQDVRETPLSTLASDKLPEIIVAIENHITQQRNKITHKGLKDAILKLTNAVGHTHSQSTAIPCDLEIMAARQVDAVKKIAHHSPPEQSRTDSLTRHSLNYTLERQQLATRIAFNDAKHTIDESPYKKSMDYFNLTLNDLGDDVIAQEALKTVKSYMHAQTRLEKGAIAVQITKEIHAHGSFVHYHGVDFERLYQDAQIFKNKKRFETLSIAEKKLTRLARRYRAMNQMGGRLYGLIKDLDKEKRPPEIVAKMEKAFARRDEIAYRFVETAEKAAQLDSYAFHEGKPVDFKEQLEAFCEDNRLKVSKILAQHDNHQEKLSELGSFSNENKAKNQSYFGPIKTIKKVHFHQHAFDLERLKNDLNAKAEQVALHYLGQPKKCRGNEWRFDGALIGADGSFVVTIRGKGQGLWNNFRGLGGDMFKLIQTRTNADFKTTLNEAANFLGGSSHYQLNNTTNVVDIEAYQKRQAEKARLEKAELDKKIAHVKTIAKGTIPITGTLAEKYLREHRGITLALNNENLRFHPALKNWSNGQIYPALVILSHDQDNTVCGVQATFLNPTTANKATIDGAIKLSRGSISQGAIVHHAIGNGAENKVTALAEGLETALSIAEAHPDWEVRLTFGVSNFEKVARNSLNENPNATLVICADNDGLHSGTAKTVEKAVGNLEKDGITVHVVEPSKPDTMEKWDFNDQLKHKGIEAVRNDLNAITLNTKNTSITLETMSKEPKQSINHSELSDKPVRTPWPNDFPDVIVHTSVKARNEHPDYALAKNGDREAAFRLIMDTLTPEALKAIQTQLGNRKPIVVSVMAQEKEGKNVIPEAFAYVLGKELNLNVDTEIIQSNYVNHTKNSAFHRMAYPATFEGNVQKGRDYLIVDDHVGLGGTLANIKGHIEKNGGHVILTTTLTASHNSQYLAPTLEQTQAIKAKYGSELSAFLNKETGHDIEHLTRAESGQILGAKDFDEIRERFVTARENSDARLLREASERRQDQNHYGALETPLTPEKEAKYKKYLKHYQSLRKLCEKTTQETDRTELRRYANKLIEQGKSLMRYAKENYPLVADNILKFSKEYTALEKLTPEKEAKYKNHLKHYQSLKATSELSKDPNDRAALTAFSHRLTRGKIFMQYTHKHYPKICQNIQNFAAEYQEKAQSLIQHHDHDKER